MRPLFTLQGGAGVAVILALLLCFSGLFTVHERDQVVVTRFSKPVHVVVGDGAGEDFERISQEIRATAAREDTMGGLHVSQGPGLYIKMPFIDRVERFPDVLMTYDADPDNVVLADKKTLIVDNFARWRIENPLLFRVSVSTVANAWGRLDDIIYSAVREELGKVTLIEAIRTTNDHLTSGPPTGAAAEDEPVIAQRPVERITRGREDIMDSVAQRADETARQLYGIRVIDVRIQRAELLPENFAAIFGRMAAERSRISTAYRSEGKKQAEIIKGNTDRRVQVIEAEAERDALKIRGEGDAAAMRAYREAFGANPDFYEYLRSLEVIKESTPEGSEIIIGLDSGIYHLLATEKP